MKHTRQDPTPWLGRDGNLVERSELVQGVMCSAEPICLLVAPSGFGKSVLASQIARSHSRWVWVDCSRTEPEPAKVARLVAAALGPERGPERPNSALLPSESESDAAACLLEELSSSDHQGLCLVLDDADAGESREPLRLVFDCLREATLSGLRLVVTSRSMPGDSAILAQAMLLSSRDLRMDAADAQQLFQAVGASWPDDSTAKQAMVVSGGQPAVLRILARQSVLGRLEDVLVWRAKSGHQDAHAGSGHDQLDREPVGCLHFLALTGHGTPRDLVDVSVRRSPCSKRFR